MAAEVQRRLVHASGTGLPVLYLLDLVTYRQLGYLLVLLAAGALGLEFLRLVVGIDWSPLNALYDQLTREYEQDNVAGYALYMVSMALVAWLFRPAAAVPGMLMLTIADPVSGLLGSGELQQVKQGWVLLATFGVATLLAVPFVPPLAAVLGGAMATLADGVKPVVAGYVVDDNLTIPPAAAVGITAGLVLQPMLPAALPVA